MVYAVPPPLASGATGSADQTFGVQATGTIWKRLPSLAMKPVAGKAAW